MIRSCLFVLFGLTVLSCNDSTDKPAVTQTREEELKEALKKYPDSLIIIENIVQFYRDAGNYDRALQITNEAIRRDSTEAMFWDMKATLHFENGDTLTTINAYKKLIELEPIPDHIIALGSVYAQLRDPKALQIADELIDTYRSTAQKEAMFIKGMYYNFTGDKKKAISFFDECLALDYTYVFAYREKAIALYDLEMYQEALAVLQKATTIKNSFEEGYYWMGRCYEKLGEIKEAQKAYQMALLYDKDYVEAAEALKAIEK